MDKLTVTFEGGIFMTLQTITEAFAQYGGIAIFIVVFLEYLNLPGFPAGIIMPLAGIWASEGNIDFFIALFLTVIAGMLGSWMLYWMGYKGGDFFLKKYFHKFPKQQTVIESKMNYLRQKGAMGIFISKLIPMVRTLISIPAGVIKMNFITYTVSSLLGVFLWNLVFVGAGYWMGDTVFTMFS